MWRTPFCDPIHITLHVRLHTSLSREYEPDGGYGLFIPLQLIQ